MKYYIHTLKGFIKSKQCYTLNPFNVQPVSKLEAITIIKEEISNCVNLEVEQSLIIIDEDDIFKFMSEHYPLINNPLPPEIETEIEEMAIGFMSRFN